MNSSVDCVAKILEKRIDMGIKPGLERIRSVLSEFTNTHSPCFFVIQVAGTNGKGTVCSLLENYFKLCNVSCGVFTSPHVEKVNERIRVDGAEISDDDFAESLKFIESVEKGIKLSYFEILTAVAIKYFIDKNVKIAVLETGMGGRLDSCTAIDKDIAVITQIDKDHCQFLGNSVEKIFYEKVAIVDNAKKVLMLPQPHASLGNLYDKYVAEKVNVEKISFIEYNQPSIAEKPKSFKKNFSLFYSIVKELDRVKLVKENTQNIEKCVDVKVKGRIDRLKFENNEIIIDVSHNPAGIQNLVDYIEKYYPNKKFTTIFGALEDKDYNAMIDTLLKITKKMYIFSPPQLTNADAKRRFANVDINYAGLKDVECEKVFEITKNIINADTIICGSFRLAGDCYSIFKNEQKCR